MAKYYEVVFCSDNDPIAARNTLKGMVEGFLENDWELAGGVAMSISPHTEVDYKEYHFAQALTLEVEEYHSKYDQ